MKPNGSPVLHNSPSAVCPLNRWLRCLLSFSLPLLLTPACSGQASQSAETEAESRQLNEAPTLALERHSPSASVLPGVDSSLLHIVLNELERHPALIQAHWSFHLLSPHGQTIASRRAHKAIIPASVFKLISSAAVLDQLGPEHRFITRLAHSGEIKEGVLRGDLYLIGAGDPSLGSGRGQSLSAREQLALWVKACREAGISRIEGRVIGEGGSYGPLESPDAWPWDDMGNYYAPALSALSFDENLFSARFKTSSTAGQRAESLGVEPALPGWNITHAVISGQKGSGDQTYVYSAPGKRDLDIRGSLPPGQSSYRIKGAWPDPELAAAQRLQLALQESGIPVELEAASGRDQSIPTALRDLHSSLSPPLSHLVKQTNEQSLNLYAESFLRALGHQSGDASVKSSLEALEAWLKERPGLDLRGWKLSDGSGLSRRNTVTGEGVCQLLAWTQQQSWAEEFMQSLPRSGLSGTMLRVADYSGGRIAAKTGTLNGIGAYAGFVQGQSGQWYPFCVMVNHSPSGSATLRNSLDPLFKAMLSLP